ncbi:transposase [Crenobacter cavernae]|uniref:Transposase DDE domain-containing protein n=1 Tax=Crenobacter cavernae TaxID=2290923 RepID=A0A345Y8H1_9NEIS|nr:hypothetical protein DWG20_12690 [Crenobacter cavernae]
MKKPYQTRYRTTNWPEYNRSLQRRADLTVWISPELPWLGNERPGQNGRPTTYRDAAIQAVLTLKVLVSLPLRQARGWVCSLLRLLKLDGSVPCYSTVSRRQVTLAVQIPVRRCHEPLPLLVDSTGTRCRAKGSGSSRGTVLTTVGSSVKYIRLTARRPERQAAAVRIRCAILNTLNRLGMPVTVPFASNPSGVGAA